MLMTTKLRISSDQHNNIFVFSGRRRSFFEDADEGVFVWIVHKENQLRLSSANFSWYNWGPCLLLTQASGELGPLPFVDPGLVANWGVPFADPGLVTSPRTAWIPKTYRRNFFCLGFRFLLLNQNISTCIQKFITSRIYGFINIWSGGRLLDDIEAEMPIPRTTIYEVK